MLIVHPNHDSLDDSPENLTAMTRTESMNYHRTHIVSYRRPRKWNIPIEILWKINRGEMTQDEAAIEIGCHISVIYSRLQKLRKLKDAVAYKKYNESNKRLCGRQFA
jgi:hypothetical protein